MKLFIIVIGTSMALVATAAKAADNHGIQAPLGQPTIEERTIGTVEARPTAPVRETTGAAIRDSGILCHEITVRTRQTGSTTVVRKLYRCD